MFEGRTDWRKHNFYPSHPRGWRRCRCQPHFAQDVFLSTPPSRVATAKMRRCHLSLQFLSTPPSRVATMTSGGKDSSAIVISIHATLAGGDSPSISMRPIREYFYPRHPRGWRLPALVIGTPRIKFLSTPPSRVATGQVARLEASCSDFYPRHPRGWRLLAQTLWLLYSEFLSTPPSRVATGQVARLEASCSDFYPRHPRGWRLLAQTLWLLYSEFLSTPPSRVATSGAFPKPSPVGISIHATLAGGDRHRAADTANAAISIHATLAGGDG